MKMEKEKNKMKVKTTLYLDGIGNVFDNDENSRTIESIGENLPFSLMTEMHRSMWMVSSYTYEYRDFLIVVEELEKGEKP